MKSETKHSQMGDHPGGGVMKEKFPHNSKLYQRGRVQWATLESQRTAQLEKSPQKLTEQQLPAEK